jgi:hypothetical protein
VRYVARNELDSGLLKAKQEMSVTAQPVKARDDALRVEDAAGGERFREGWPVAVILVIRPSTQENGPCKRRLASP